MLGRRRRSPGSHGDPRARGSQAADSTEEVSGKEPLSGPCGRAEKNGYGVGGERGWRLQGELRALGWGRSTRHQNAASPSGASGHHLRRSLHHAAEDAVDGSQRAGPGRARNRSGVEISFPGGWGGGQRWRVRNPRNPSAAQRSPGKKDSSVARQPALGPPPPGVARSWRGRGRAAERALRADANCI